MPSAAMGVRDSDARCAAVSPRSKPTSAYSHRRTTSGSTRVARRAGM
jgi:hypothetical protein